MSHTPARGLPASIERSSQHVAGALGAPGPESDPLPRAAARLREQFIAALIPYNGPQPDGADQYVGGDYLLGPASPLPTWFNTALFGIPLQASDGPYPEVARIWDAVDWPGLLDDHPEFLAIDHELNDLNNAPHWAQVRDTYTTVNAAGHIPMLDVAVSVSRDAKITLCPLGLIVPHVSDNTLIQAISEILVGDPANPHSRAVCDDLREHTGHVEWSW